MGRGLGLAYENWQGFLRQVRCRTGEEKGMADWWPG